MTVETKITLRNKVRDMFFDLENTEHLSCDGTAWLLNRMDQLLDDFRSGNEDTSRLMVIRNHLAKADKMGTGLNEWDLHWIRTWLDIIADALKTAV